jgi:hypothetical protein
MAVAVTVETLAIWTARLSGDSGLLGVSIVLTQKLTMRAGLARSIHAEL